jgi:hypothetical protein
VLYQFSINRYEYVSGIHKEEIYADKKKIAYHIQLINLIELVLPDLIVPINYERWALYINDTI